MDFEVKTNFLDALLSLSLSLSHTLAQKHISLSCATTLKHTSELPLPPFLSPSLSLSLSLSSSCDPIEKTKGTKKVV